VRFEKSINRLPLPEVPIRATLVAIHSPLAS
jgi:hypothetical protein